MYISARPFQYSTKYLWFTLKVLVSLVFFRIPQLFHVPCWTCIINRVFSVKLNWRKSTSTGGRVKSENIILSYHGEITFSLQTDSTNILFLSCTYIDTSIVWVGKWKKLVPMYWYSGCSENTCLIFSLLVFHC